MKYFVVIEAGSIMIKIFHLQYAESVTILINDKNYSSNYFILSGDYLERCHLNIAILNILQTHFFLSS